jgi:lysophospholipase L1-like esterase
LQERFPQIEIDAMISRHANQALQVLRDRLARDAPVGEVVVLHVGTNSPMTPEQFDGMLQLVATVPRVVVLNVKAPRRWEGPNNQVIADVSARYPNVVLVDWRAATIDHPEFFGRDGIHLKIGGVNRFVELVSEAILRP